MVIKVEQVGGFVGPNVLVARLPQIVVYSDGLILAEKSSNGSLSQMYRGKLSVSLLKSEISAMSKAAQTPVGGWGLPGVADVPSTQVSVLQGGKKSIANVFALGFTTGNLSKAALNARNQLSTAITKLRTLAGTGQIYSPESYEVWPLWPSTGEKPNGVDLTNPAAIFCLSQNGTLANGTVALDSSTPAPNLSTEYCHLADGSFVEEWKFFYQASRTGALWPSQVSSPQGRCSSVHAQPFTSLLAKSSNKPWLLPSGAMISLTWRPILPGEVACKR